MALVVTLESDQMFQKSRLFFMHFVLLWYILLDNTSADYLSLVKHPWLINNLLAIYLPKLFSSNQSSG